MLSREDVENFGLPPKNMLEVVRNADLDEPTKTQFCAELRLQIFVEDALNNGLFLTPDCVKKYVDAVNDIKVAWRIIARSCHSKQRATHLTNYTPPES